MYQMYLVPKKDKKVGANQVYLQGKKIHSWGTHQKLRISGCHLVLFREAQNTTSVEKQILTGGKGGSRHEAFLK